MKSIKTEVFAGLTLFLAMVYIVPFNTMMLAKLGIEEPHASTMTVMVVAAATMLMALWGRMPYCIGPGAILAPVLIAGAAAHNLASAEIFGVVFAASIVFAALVFSGGVVWIFRRLPADLMAAISFMLGIFLVLKGAEIVELRESLFSAQCFALLEGLAVTAMMFHYQSSRNLAVLGGILSVTVVTWMIGAVVVPSELFARPEFNLVEVNIWASLDPSLLSLVGVVLLLLIADVPVAPYALTGTTEQLQVQEGKHSGEPRNYLRTLQAAALVSPLTSFFGMPPSIIFFESGAAITAGGRTGITAAVAALLFLPLLFAAPLIAMIPIAASALVLIVVGLSIASGGLSRSPKTSESNLLFGIVLASFLVSDSLATGIMAGIATSSVLASRRWLLETQAAK